MATNESATQICQDTLKESFQNILIGFNNDIREHEYLLGTMDDKPNKYTCDQCGLITDSKGKLKAHLYDEH